MCISDTVCCKSLRLSTSQCDSHQHQHLVCTGIQPPPLVVNSGTASCAPNLTASHPGSTMSWGDPFPCNLKASVQHHLEQQEPDPLCPARFAICAACCRHAASLVVFGDPHRFEERWRERRRAIHEAPIFPAATAASSSNVASAAGPAKASKSGTHLPKAPANQSRQHGARPGVPPTEPRPQQSARPHGTQSAGKANKLLQKARSLGLNQGGVLKPGSSASSAGSRSGSKHMLSQTGKLSRLRLGAKLVLADVPA